jgi:cholesterol oxidase
MVGCRVGAKNTLDKNYLWLAERKGAAILPEHFVTDIRPLGAADGSEGYLVTTERPGAWFRKQRRQFRTRGVVVAAGAVETNHLLLHCKLTGSLPAISDRLGTLVRTNSESILAVKLPASTKLELWRDVGNSASIFTSPDTHVEFCTYGEGGDAMATFFTLMVGKGTGLTRPLKLLGSMLLHPLAFLQTLWPVGWSRRTAVLLVMQSLDNSITFTARRRRFGNGIRMSSEPDPLKPAPTYIEAAQRVAAWAAKRYGGIAQSAIPEALLNVPSTSHVLGGAPIGSDSTKGVLDRHNRVFGYENLLVCCGAAMPTNPGVNPSLTITALAEHAMSRIPVRAQA